MAKRLQFHNLRETYEVSGILYHCDFCGKTYVEKFIHGPVYLPIGAKGIEEQKELNSLYGKIGTLFHRDGCVCKDCITLIDDYEEALIRTEAFLQINSIIYGCQNDVLTVIDAIDTKLHSIVKRIIKNIHKYVHFQNATHDENTIMSDKKSTLMMIKKYFSILLPVVNAQIRSSQVPQLQKDASTIIRSYKKEFNIVKKETRHFFKTGEQLILMSCLPMTSINLNEYLRKTSDYDILLKIDTEDEDNDFRLMTMIDVTSIPFPKIDFFFKTGVKSMLYRELKAKFCEKENIPF